MYLSMWILADWLQTLEPEAEICAGGMDIAGLRLGEAAKDCASLLQREDGAAVCAFGEDRLVFRKAGVETVLNRALEAFSFYDKWERRNIETIYEGRSLQTLVDDADAVFANPITVFGSGYTLETASSAFPPGSLEDDWDYLLRERVNTMETMPEIQTLLQNLRGTTGVQLVVRQGPGWRQLMRNLYVRGEFAGFINIREYQRPLSRGMEQLLELFGRQMEAWLELNQSEKPARSAQRLLRSLLKGETPDTDKLNRYLILGGWEASDEKLIYKLGSKTFDPYRNEMLMQQLSRSLPDGHVVAMEDGAAMLVRLSAHAQQRMEEFVMSILRTFDCFAVSGIAGRRLEDAARSYRFCDIAFELCPGISGEIYRCADYALAYMCSQLHRHVPDVLEHPALQILRAYDQRHGTVLLRTLKSFLMHERNLVRTVAALYIHRNSLVYRVKKITELTGVDLDDEGTRLYLLLSCLSWT